VIAGTSVEKMEEALNYSWHAPARYSQGLDEASKFLALASM